MKVWGQLENAQLENKASNYTAGPVGRIWWNTATTKATVDDGTNIRALLRNDGFCVFGNNGTANSNIRLHRGAAGVLQFVTGGDVTAEGTLSTSLNQISGRLENYTDGTKPTFGNAGRAVWLTDLAEIAVDTGVAWNYISSAISGRVNAFWVWVLGSAAQVTSGVATHSTWAAVIAAASAGDQIIVLPGSWTENATITKQLSIVGAGYGSRLNGTLTFTAASRCSVRNLRVDNTVTLDSSSNLNKVDTVWLASGISFSDSGTGNLLEAFQET